MCCKQGRSDLDLRSELKKVDLCKSPTLLTIAWTVNFVYLLLSDLARSQDFAHFFAVQFFPLCPSLGVCLSPIWLFQLHNRTRSNDFR